MKTESTNLIIHNSPVQKTAGTYVYILYHFDEFCNIFERLFYLTGKTFIQIIKIAEKGILFPTEMVYNYLCIYREDWFNCILVKIQM